MANALGLGHTQQAYLNHGMKLVNCLSKNCYSTLRISLLELFLLCHLLFARAAIATTAFVPDRPSAAGERREFVPSMVSLYGQTRVSVRRSAARWSPKTTATTPGLVRPADPSSVLRAPERLEEAAGELAEWLSSRRRVVALTGAGLSTDSGIPDYRGHKGSYHLGHKPMLHQQFMEVPHQRKRYWGRSMVGWKPFDAAEPNRGHYALAALEQMGRLGVFLEDREEFYDDPDDFLFSSGQRKLSIVTQNVDALHDRAGSRDVLALHGGNRLVQCTSCGHRLARSDYQQQLEDSNEAWLNKHAPRLEREETSRSSHRSSVTKPKQLRPDGDAQLERANFEEVVLPPCSRCGDGIFKPDVVFFGDSVPRHRVRICEEAVEQSDGILVVGSSLSVHSALRHVRAASRRGLPVAILNVGETRAEAEGLPGLTKIEAPIGDTLERCVALLKEKAANQSIDETIKR